MRPVYIIGAGSSPFGKLKDRDIRSMAEEALWGCLKDAGTSPGRIQVAYCGSVGILSGQETIVGQVCLQEVGIVGIPVTHVENACASSSCAFREAWIAVGSGLYDLALAFGVEKMSGASWNRLLMAARSGSDNLLEANFGITFPGVFGMYARRRMADYGNTREQMALVSVKNHRHGMLNPGAHYRKEVTVEEVLSSRPVADPLRLLECCPMSDGCSAVVLAAGDALKGLERPGVGVLSSVLVSGTYRDDQDLTNFEPTRRAAEQAYREASVGAVDIDLAEVHDCFSVAELMHYEDLGFCPAGEGGPMVESGETSLGGRIPVNVSGGLLAKGHPVGATGVGQIVELVQQLRSEAGHRQVEGARVGLAHCMGGFMHSDSANASITILGR